MAEASRCEECGADLAPESSPGGLCPNCLLKLALPGSDEAPITPRTESSGRPPSLQIGRYRLQQKIGEGGMGEVWVAEQQAPLRRKVAVKLIKRGLDTDQVVARFEAERQALALMSHPNIAKVLDAGATDEGRPYFVMEYVSGVPITTYCDTQRVTTTERLALFMSVCDGVQHAHQKGIIHRDIKPSNVLVELRDGSPVPKIIDFGVAKATQQRLSERSMFTELGVLIGTPEYMSPEQAEMTVLDVDTRTDVYSLGMLLYELLVGALPFDTRELRAAGFDEIRRRIREERPSKPSARITTLGDSSKQSAMLRRTDPVSLIRELRGDLDWIAMHALEKERARRYGSPSDLAADIRRFLNHEPVLAGPPSVAYRAKKFVRRHRIAVGASAAVLAALVVGLGAATYGLIEARRANERTREEAATAEQVSEFLVGLFEVSDPNEARGNTITAREVLDRGAARIDTELSDQPRVQDRLRHTMGRVYRNLGVQDEAARLLERALAGQHELLGDQHPDTLATMLALARQRTTDNRYEDAERLYAEALETSRRVLGPEAETTLRAMGHLGNVYRIRARYDEAESLLVSALESQRRVLGEDHAATQATIASLAHLYTLQRRYEEAEVLQLEALELARRNLGEDHPDTLATIELLFLLYGYQSRHGDAESLGIELLAARRRVLGEDHPETLGAMGLLGWHYLSRDRHEDAEPLLVEALARSRDRLREDHPIRLQNTVLVAALRRDQGRYEEAETLAREGLEHLRRIAGDEHTDTVWAVAVLKNIYRLQGRYDEAEPLAREVLAHSRRFLGEEHSMTLRNVKVLADIYRAQGRDDAARPLVEELLAARREAAEKPEAGPKAKNRYAWPLLTWEPADLRDPETALEFALEANELSGFKKPMYLDTLALAYYRTGDATMAVDTQRKALSVLPDGDPRHEKFRKRLAEFDAVRHEEE